MTGQLFLDTEPDPEDVHERVAEVKPRAVGEALSEVAPYWTVMRSAGRIPGAGLLVAGRRDGDCGVVPVGPSSKRKGSRGGRRGGRRPRGWSPRGRLSSRRLRN